MQTKISLRSGTELIINNQTVQEIQQLIKVGGNKFMDAAAVKYPYNQVHFKLSDISVIEELKEEQDSSEHNFKSIIYTKKNRKIKLDDSVDEIYKLISKAHHDNKEPNYICCTSLGKKIFINASDISTFEEF
ncbi:MAG: hypothetical protein ACRCZW_14870 [Lactobacillaceae bacterium]